jgi:hypothetical protein
MSAACICPDVPSLEGVATIPTEPLVCGCCGTPLRLTCDGECGPEHVRGAFAAVAAKNAKSVRVVSAPECGRCHRPMPKKTGRPAKFCDACLTPAELEARDAKRLINNRTREEERNA